MRKKQIKWSFIACLILAGVMMPSYFLKAQMLTSQNSTNKKLVDQVVAVVNSHVILKSDVDQRVKQLLYQLRQNRRNDTEFSQDMWYSSLHQLVNSQVMLIHARLDSVTASDDRVNKRVNARVNYAISQAGGQAALESQLGKSITQLKAKLRPEFRKQQIIKKYKQERLSKVTITRPEVKHFFHQFPEDSIPEIPEKVAISQIVVVAPPKKEALQDAREQAEQIRDSILNDGKSFEKMAKKYSDGPAASSGGHIPMIPIDKLTPYYAAAASALQAGQISEVVKTPFGFHIIRLNKRQGNKIDTNNILISLDEDSYNKQAAIKELKQIKDSIETNDDITFAEEARKLSDDPNTAPLGGRILDPRSGNQLLTTSSLAPSLYRIVLPLKNPGDISEPVSFKLPVGNSTKAAYRIVRLDSHVPKHTENLKQDYESIKNIALQEKQHKVFLRWIKDLKKDVYVDYKIPIPKQNSNLAQR